MIKPVRAFQVSVAIVGVAVVAGALLMNRPSPPPPTPPPPPPPPPVVEVKPKILDFPIAAESLVKLNELFGKVEAIEAFCNGKDPLEPKLKFLHETSEVLLRHVAADTLPAGDLDITFPQLVTELGRYRLALWQMACKNTVGGTAQSREVTAESLLKTMNRPVPRNDGYGYSSNRLQEGPLTIVFPDGRRQAAYWNNSRLYEVDTPVAADDKKPATPQAEARERCLRLYDEITQTLADWQDAKWVAVKKPRSLTSLCELFFLTRSNPNNNEDYQIQNENQNRIQSAFRRFFNEYYDSSSQALPELSWRVNPRLPELFLPIIKAKPEALKSLYVNNYYWDSNYSSMSLPRSETAFKIEKTSSWVRDYIMACASIQQTPESQQVVNGLVKEMVAQVQIPPATWDDWVVRQNIVAVLDHWRNMVWLGMAKPPELAQAQIVPRTWFEALTEMMAGEPVWATSLLSPPPIRGSASPVSWSWSNDGSESTGRMVALNKEMLDRIEAAWGRQKSFVMPKRIAPPLHPFLQAGPLALTFEMLPVPNGQAGYPDRQGDVLVPAKMWLDDQCLQLLSQRLSFSVNRVPGSRTMMTRYQTGISVADEPGALDRLVTLLAARYQTLSADTPIEALQKENLRLKLINLRSNSQRGLPKLTECLASLTLPNESFLNRPEFKTAVMPQPDDILKVSSTNQDSSTVIRQYDLLVGMDKEYFKTHCFTGPMDKAFIAGLAAIMPPRLSSTDDRTLKFQTAMLEMLDRSVVQRAQAAALKPGDSQENFDNLTLALLDVVSAALKYGKGERFQGYNSDSFKKINAMGQQMHQMLGRWRDAKDWTALKKPRWIRLLPSQEAFMPAPRVGTNYYDDSSRSQNPCFFENLLFRLAAGGGDQEKAYQDLQNMNGWQSSSVISQALTNLTPDQEFVEMTARLMTRNNKTQGQDWRWQSRQLIIGNLHSVILGKIAQEKLPETCKAEDIAKLVEQMIVYYQEEKGSSRSRLALALYTLQKSPWLAMPIPEKLKALNLVDDLPADVRRLLAP